MLFGQAAEKEAILKMAKSETDAYMKGDLQEWPSYRIHDSNARFTYIANEVYMTLKGWDTINKVFMKILKEQTSIPYTVKNNNTIIRVNGNLAWIEFDQLLTISIADSTEKRFTHGKRTLLKENGKWKILSRRLESYPDNS